jgi:hypothetical protein
LRRKLPHANSPFRVIDWNCAWPNTASGCSSSTGGRRKTHHGQREYSQETEPRP